MQNITSPKGKAVYPQVNEPNYKFDANGMYSIKLHLTEEDFKAFEGKVKEYVEAQYQAKCAETGKKLKRATSSPCRITDEGDFEIYAKQAAKKDTVKGPMTFSIALFDSQAKPMSEKIGSGSICKIAVKPWTWYNPSLGFGYTLQLSAVQVIELVEYSSGGSSMFSVEDGGFVSESLDSAFTKEEDTDFAPSF